MSERPLPPLCSGIWLSAVFNESLAARSRWQWRSSAVGVGAGVGLNGILRRVRRLPSSSSSCFCYWHWHFQPFSQGAEDLPDIPRFPSEDGAKLRMRMSASQAPSSGITESRRHAEEETP